MPTQKIAYQLSRSEVLAHLQVIQKAGLRRSEITTRQRKWGLNQLPRGPAFSPLKLFFRQFRDVLIIILLVAATISLGVSYLQGEELPTEALLIYAIVFAIAVVGFLNEYKAERTVQALRSLLSHVCKVRRDGEVIELPIEELVPGDIVLVGEGDKVPADIRLLAANRLEANEASLTGESIPVHKQTAALSGQLALGDQRNMLFSGTLITTGTGEGVVVGTGAHTEIGKIADMVAQVEQDETPMQRKLNQLGRRLGLMIAVICVAVFIIIFFLDRAALTLDLAQRLLFAFTAAIALAVAAIPEGLAFVVRISLALGARRMATKKALVRKLSAVESLGSTDVICSDKTGTLTRGEMTVRKLYVAEGWFELTGEGYKTAGELLQNGAKITPSDDVRQLLTVGLLCNNARLRGSHPLGDPTEGCLLVSAAKIGLPLDLEKQKPRLREVPFSSERKRMTTVHKDGRQMLVATKGAADVLVDHCTHYLKNGRVLPMDEVARTDIRAAAASMANDALRILGFAYRHVDELPGSDEALESQLIFVGLQGMMDPPRIEVRETIRRVQRDAGMRVIMITGDNPQTAQAVAREIGITGEVLVGAELAAMSEEQLRDRAEHINIYARVNPADKIKIVRALQHHGHQVAMTGDGVNDAPAIKAADIGIAMGITGTDAAKEASDMILLDDKFVTIIKAVEEGRGIFDNVRKFVNFLLSCNIGEVLAILLGILVHGNLVLTAAQILFVNIVTDGIPAVALGSDPAPSNVMKHKPGRYQGSIVTRRVWIEIIIFGILMAGALLLQYNVTLHNLGPSAAIAGVFVGMVVYEFVRLIDIRTDYRISWWSNPWLTVSLVASMLIQLAILYVEPLADLFQVEPIATNAWLFIIVASACLFAIMKMLNPLLDYVGPENEPHKLTKT